MKHKRTLAFGDIHGGYLALQQVMDRAKVSEDDRLIFLGDYVDGWSQSPEVLDFLMELSQKQTCIFLRGNHDDLLYDWMHGKENKLWFLHGGESTMRAYSQLNLEHKKRHIEFLGNLHNYFVDEENRLFVHAGFTNMHGIQHEYFPNMAFWDRTLWETATSLNPNLDSNDPAYPKRLRLYHEIFIGHTPVTRINQTVPTQRANVWNLDTGAAFRGCLSCLDVDSKQYWQSDNLPLLYPDETGRNT